MEKISTYTSPCKWGGLICGLIHPRGHTTTIGLPHLNEEIHLNTPYSENAYVVFSREKLPLAVKNQEEDPYVVDSLYLTYSEKEKPYDTVKNSVEADSYGDNKLVAREEEEPPYATIEVEEEEYYEILNESEQTSVVVQDDTYLVPVPSNSVEEEELYYPVLEYFDNSNGVTQEDNIYDNNLSNGVTPQEEDNVTIYEEMPTELEDVTVEEKSLPALTQDKRGNSPLGWFRDFVKFALWI